MIGATLIAASIIFYRLGTPSVYWWDEARTAVNSLEMMQHPGVVVTFHHEPELWNTKPPLAVWLNALSMRLFGPNEWALRLPAGLAAVGTCIAVYRFTKRRADEKTGLLAVLVLLGCGGFLEIHTSRTADCESLLVLFMTVTTFSLFDAFQTKRFAIPATSGALALLTKGIAGLTMLPGYAAYALIYHRDTIRRMIVPALCAVVPLLLFYAAREAVGPGYLAAMVNGDLHRTVAVEDNHASFNYLLKLLWPWQAAIVNPVLVAPFSASACPWSFVMLGALYRPSRAAIYLFCCLGSLLLLATLTATKLPWYVAPAFPLIAVLAALATRRWFPLMLPIALVLVGFNVWKVDRWVERAPRWMVSQGHPQTPKVVGGKIVGMETYNGPRDFYRERD